MENEVQNNQTEKEVRELRALRQEIRGLRNDLRSYAYRTSQKLSFRFYPIDPLPDIPNLE